MLVPHTLFHTSQLVGWITPQISCFNFTLDSLRTPDIVLLRAFCRSKTCRKKVTNRRELLTPSTTYTPGTPDAEPIMTDRQSGPTSVASKDMQVPMVSLPEVSVWCTVLG